MGHPLEGIRVVDLTTNIAGPFCTQVLGDLGADVVKIERPHVGDDTRSWGPPFFDSAGRQGVIYESINRNKRSVCLDLKRPKHQEVLNRLIRWGDVVVQNLRPGSLARMGYTPERIFELNERIVYCEITGFGHTGPKAERPAFDPLMQAFTGLMAMVGGEGEPPARIPVSILDKGAGMWAAIAVQSGLIERQRTGRGSHVQTSLLETAAMWQGSQIMSYCLDGSLPKKHGSGTGGIAPYEAFRTADDFLLVAAGNQRLWQGLCRALGREDLEHDESYLTNTARVENRHQLARELEATLIERPVDHWLEVLETHGVPCSRIQTTGQMVEDEHVQQLGVVQQFPPLDPGRPRATVPIPIWMDGERPSDLVPPSALGADTDEVLRELGYSRADQRAIVESTESLDERTA